MHSLRNNQMETNNDSDNDISVNNNNKRNKLIFTATKQKQCCTHLLLSFDLEIMSKGDLH